MNATLMHAVCRSILNITACFCLFTLVTLSAGSFVGCGGRAEATPPGQPPSNPAADNQVEESPNETDSDRSTTLEDPAEDPIRYIDELSDAEWRTFCSWMIEVQGGEGHTQDCGDGVSFTIDTVDDCVRNTPRPHCDIEDLRACVEGQAQNPCVTAPPACDTLYRCAYAS